MYSKFACDTSSSNRILSC